MIACMVHLAIFAMAAVMLKSGHDGSMGGGLSNYCDGSSFAKIDHDDSICNFCDESNYAEIGRQ